MSDRKYRLRNLLVTGLLFMIPVGVSYWVLSFLVRKTQGWARPLVNKVVAFLFEANQIVVPEWLLTGISIILVVVIVASVGALANFYIGKKVLDLVDRLMLRVPIVRSVYGGTKQIIEAFSLQRSAGAFKTVVMLEYPRRDCWVLGFVTNEDLAPQKRLYGANLVAVFVPSTPNPTTGFLLYLDPEELFVIDIAVEDAVKLIVSAGIVLPKRQPNPPVTLGQLMAGN